MQTTSHFVGMSLKPEILSDIFVEVYKYIKEQKIQDIVCLQNPLSPHITLYYLEKDIPENDKDSIKKYISKIDVSQSIFLSSFDYFSRNESRFILYLTASTDFPLKKYRDDLHKLYNRKGVINNSLDFSPHITFLRILNLEIFENHRENIEKIITKELSTLKELDIHKKEISLYAVNSTYKEEIQIVI